MSEAVLWQWLTSVFLSQSALDLSRATAYWYNPVQVDLQVQTDRHIREPGTYLIRVYAIPLASLDRIYVQR